MLERISARVAAPAHLSLVEREEGRKNMGSVRPTGNRQPAIVVGVDFSPQSRRALDRAVDVARARHARLHLLHVTSEAESVREAMAALDAEIRASGIPTSLDVSGGSLPHAMQRTARALDAELVVVGARGRVLPDAILGSSGERIASVVRRPVLVVRRAMTRSYTRVVMAIDRGSDLKRMAAAARSVAPGVRPTLLHAYEGPFESAMRLDGTAPPEMRFYRSRVREEVRGALVGAIVEAGLDPRSLVLRHGGPWRVLELEDEENRDRDTLFVLAPRRSVVRHLVFGSVTRWMLARGRSDVLLV